MFPKRVQIMRIDPKRWGLLSVPPAVMAGLVGTVIVTWPNVLMVVLLGWLVAGAVGFVAFAIGWLGAVLTNIFFRLIGGGPIVEIRELGASPDRWQSRGTRRGASNTGETQNQATILQELDRKGGSENPGT